MPDLENREQTSQPEDFWIRARELVATGDFRRAISLLEKTLDATPDDVLVKRALADLYLRSDQIDAALIRIEELVHSFPTDVDLLIALGQAYQHIAIKRYADAKEMFQRALHEYPRNYLAQLELAQTCKATFDLHGARAHFESAIKLRPNEAELYMHLGTVFRDLGYMDAAETHLRRAVQLDRNCSEAYRHLMYLRRQDNRNEFTPAMERFFDEEILSIDQKVDFAFALGKAFDDLNETDRAFRYWQAGNRLKRETLDFSVDDIDVFFRRIEKECDSRFFGRSKEGCDDRGPIFVVGMFRSGTSLVHQILASHSEVYGAGEQPFLDEVCLTPEGLRYPVDVSIFGDQLFKKLGESYMEKVHAVVGEETYFVDKMPQNFQFLGLVSKILPNAKIISCVRNPMDTCFSIYKNFFGGRHPYAWNQHEIGAVYSSYRRLMLHWYKHLSDRIHIVRYEDLVKNTEFETKQLLDFCGLKFEPACLEFWKSKSTVSTASAAQVRRGIYSDSISGWRRYEQHLQPLVDSLE